MDYEGERLSQTEYDERYPEGTDSDYSVGIDGNDQDGFGGATYVDAADASRSNLARFMNHASDAGNEGMVAPPTCYALTLCEPRARLMLFAGRDLEVGEELVWDYGAGYWAGRDDMI